MFSWASLHPILPLPSVREEGRSHNPHFTDEKTELPKDLRTQDSLGHLKLTLLITVLLIPGLGVALLKANLSTKALGVETRMITFGLPWRLGGKESACRCRRHEFDP